MSGLFQKSIQLLKLHGNFVVVCICAFVAGTKVCGFQQILKGVLDSREARNRCFTDTFGFCILFLHQQWLWAAVRRAWEWTSGPQVDSGSPWKCDGSGRRVRGKVPGVRARQSNGLKEAKKMPERPEAGGL